MSQNFRVVCIGGGTGLSTLLRGIKQYSARESVNRVIDLDHLTAIVSVSDDGGSSGKLIDEFGVLPPGDIRNCLVALSDESEIMSALFGHRLSGGEALSGHSIGNLLLIALTQMNDGNFPKAIADASRVLSVRGRILPTTLEATVLCAELTDGEIVQSESYIPKRENRKPIRRVFLARRINGPNNLRNGSGCCSAEPFDCPAYTEALEAIHEAEAIVLGPGSLYTSILPNLAVPEIADALTRSQATKIYVCNAMSEPGETDNYSVSDHVAALQRHADVELDYILVNRAIAPRDLIRQYVRESLLEQFQRIQAHVREAISRLEDNADEHIESLQSIAEQIAHISQDSNRMVDASTVQVLYDEEKDAGLADKIVLEDLICDMEINERGVTKRVIRHDPMKLAQALSKLLTV